MFFIISGFAHAADPFLQNVGKLVVTIMENLVLEDHFDDLGVILRAWRVQNCAGGVRELPKRFLGRSKRPLGRSKRPLGGSAGSPEGSQETFGVALGGFWGHLGGQWGPPGSHFWVQWASRGLPRRL